MLLHFIVFLKLPNLKTSRCMQYFHFVLKTNLCAKKRNTTHFVRYFFFATDYFKTCYRAFSCDVIAAMLEGKNDTFSLPWEMRSVFMQNCFIVSDYQHIHDQDNYVRKKHKRNYKRNGHIWKVGTERGASCHYSQFLLAFINSLGSMFPQSFGFHMRMQNFLFFLA